MSEEVKLRFDEIKKKKSFRYVVFFIKDEKSIAVETTGARGATYDEYLRDLVACGPDDCRYGLYDFEYEHQCQGTTETTKKEKLLLMSWCPDTAKIKKKMLYSSSFDALKKCLVGVQKYIQVRERGGSDRRVNDGFVITVLGFPGDGRVRSLRRGCGGETQEHRPRLVRHKCRSREKYAAHTHEDREQKVKKKSQHNTRRISASGRKEKQKWRRANCSEEITNNTQLYLRKNTSLVIPFPYTETKLAPLSTQYMKGVDCLQ